MRDLKKVYERTLQIDCFGLTLADPIEFMNWEQAKCHLKDDYVRKIESGEEK